jgi:hypothetical protein
MQTISCSIIVTACPFEKVDLFLEVKDDKDDTVLAIIPHCEFRPGKIKKSVNNP